MKLQLSKAEVEVKENLTWGDKEKIQSTLMRGAKINGKGSATGDLDFDFDTSAMLESKYVTLECLVTKIKEGDKELSFTREWMDNLSTEDGDKLFEAVDGVAKKGQHSTDTNSNES